MKKPFLIPFVLGAAIVMCIGAMIHEYPATTTPALTSFTLLDTWDGATGAYNSVRLSDIRTAMFASPTFTGTVTVSGTVSTNEFGGVNTMTNINGITLSWITNQVVVGAGTTNTIIYLGLQ